MTHQHQPPPGPPGPGVSFSSLLGTLPAATAASSEAKEAWRPTAQMSSARKRKPWAEVTVDFPVNPMALTRWKPLYKPWKSPKNHGLIITDITVPCFFLLLDGHLRECNSFSNTWRSEVLESEFVITTLRTHIQNHKSIMSGPIFVVF